MFRHSFITGLAVCLCISHSSAIHYKGEKIPFKLIVRHFTNSFKRYSFDKIVEAGTGGPRVIFDTNRTIISITDGLQIPIYVGSIPRTARHLRQLRADAKLKSDMLIGLYTLNTSDEQNKYKLSTTITDDGFTLLHQYPTIDYTAPSISDLTQGVYDLSARNTHQEKIACIHCRAGIGRSVTLTAAYLLYIYSIASKQYSDGSQVSEEFDDSTIITMIIEYIKTKRPVAHPNIKQRTAMKEFYTAWRTAESLENLYQQVPLYSI